MLKHSPKWEEAIARIKERNRRLFPGGIQVESLCDPDCETCGGSGTFISNGYEFACPNSKDLRDVSPHTLTFDRIPDEGNILQAKMAIKNLLALGSGWLYLWGRPGRGKTTLLKAAQNEETGKGGRYTDTLAVIDDLRGSFDEQAGQTTLQRRQSKWIEIPKLFMDEFDRVNLTGFAQERLYRVMDGRYQGALDGKSLTIMASNSPPGIYEPYLKDRIEEFQVLEIITPMSLRL